MADEKLPATPPDVYADQFQITLGPYGATLGFQLSKPTPPVPGTTPQADRVVTVRMSLEHLKVMAFLLTRHLRQYQREAGITVPLPGEVLNSLRIGREDWDAFWGG